MVDIRDKIKNGHMNASVGFLKALEENRNYKDKKLRDMFSSPTKQYSINAITPLYRTDEEGNEHHLALVNESFYHISPTDGEEIPEDVACFVLEQLELSLIHI